MDNWNDDEDITPVMTAEDFAASEESYRMLTQDPDWRWEIRRTFLKTLCDNMMLKKDIPFQQWYASFRDEFILFLSMDGKDMTLQELRNTFGRIFSTLKKLLDEKIE